MDFGLGLANVLRKCGLESPISSKPEGLEKGILMRKSKLLDARSKRRPVVVQMLLRELEGLGIAPNEVLEPSDLKELGITDSGKNHNVNSGLFPQRALRCADLFDEVFDALGSGRHADVKKHLSELEGLGVMPNQVLGPSALAMFSVHNVKEEPRARKIAHEPPLPVFHSCEIHHPTLLGSALVRSVKEQPLAYEIAHGPAHELPISAFHLPPISPALPDPLRVLPVEDIERLRTQSIATSLMRSVKDEPRAPEIAHESQLPVIHSSPTRPCFTPRPPSALAPRGKNGLEGLAEDVTLDSRSISKSTTASLRSSSSVASLPSSLA